MLYSEPKSFFGRTLNLMVDGTQVGSIRFASFKEAGTLTLGEQEYELASESRLKSRFVLRKKGEADVLATAQKSSVLSSQIDLTYGDLSFELVRPSVWTAKYKLMWEGEDAGEIRSKGGWGRKALVDLPDSLPIEFRAFALWLVHVMWNRAAAAAV